MSYTLPWYKDTERPLWSRTAAFQYSLKQESSRLMFMTELIAKLLHESINELIHSFTNLFCVTGLQKFLWTFMNFEKNYYKMESTNTPLKCEFGLVWVTEPGTNHITSKCHRWTDIQVNYQVYCFGGNNEALCPLSGSLDPWCHKERMRWCEFPGIRHI